MEKIEIELSEDQFDAIIGLLKQHLSITYQDNTFNDIDVVDNQFYEHILINFYRKKESLKK